MSGLVFAREDLRDIFPEVEHLWLAHWNETEGYRASEPYAPDREQYRRMEEWGMWRHFTARDEADGVLVGHIGYLVHTSRHTSRKNAVEDFFYLMPQYRRGLNAIKLLRFAVRELRAEGCKQIGMSSKLTNDIEPLLRRVGFKYVAKFYVLLED